MAQAGDLSWNVEEVSSNWITVTPMAGTGNTSLTVEVRPTESVNDETEGYIKLTCENGDSKIINVERCKAQCEYGPDQITYDSVKNVEVRPCETSTTFTVIQTITRRSTNGCSDDVRHADEEITVNFETNQTDSSRVVAQKQGAYVVTQLAGPCVSCGCNSLTLSTIALEWNWDDMSTLKTVDIVVKPRCVDYVTITNVTTSITGFDVAYNSSTKIITVKPSGKNESTTSVKSGIITISYQGTGEPCTATVSLTQNKKGVCTITANPSSLTCDGGDVQFSVN